MKFVVSLLILMSASSGFSEAEHDSSRGIDTSYNNPAPAYGAYNPYATPYNNNPYMNPYGGINPNMNPNYNNLYMNSMNPYGNMGMMGMNGMGMNNNQTQRRQAANEITKFGQENQKRMQESSKEFQQNIEKMNQSFVNSLDKLNPPDKTAEALKEINRAQRELAQSLKEEKNPRNEIVDEIVKDIKDQQDKREASLSAISQMLNTQTQTTAKSTPLPNMVQRLSSQIVQAREVNPLSVAMQAEPPLKNTIPSFSSRTQSVPLSPRTNEPHKSGAQSFFPEAKTYKSPI